MQRGHYCEFVIAIQTKRSPESTSMIAAKEARSVIPPATASVLRGALDRVNNKDFHQAFCRIQLQAKVLS
jgi:hypothetical protein